MSTVPSNEFDRNLDEAGLRLAYSDANPAWRVTAPAERPLARIAAETAHWVRAHARFVITMAACALYLLPFMRVMFTRADEGIFLCGAERLVHGQVFARDFMEVMGPGTFYWLALFYRAFGISFFAAHLCLFLTWMVTLALIYQVSRCVAAPYRLLPLLLIVDTCLISLGLGISHHVDSNCLALLTVLCLSEWHGKQKTRWLFFAGALAALTALVHQHKGLLLLIAALAWIWMVERKKPTTVRALATATVGFAGILFIAALYFANQGGLADIIRANCLWPVQHYSAINKVPFGWGLFSFFWRGVPLSTPDTYGIFLFSCLLIAPFLFVVVLPGLLILQVCGRRLPAMPADVWLYLLCGAALWISELHRTDITHLAFGSPVLIILSIRFLSESTRRLSRLALVLLTGSAGTLAICSLLSVVTAHPVATRVGEVRLLNSGQEIAALNMHFAPGEEVFVYPYCPTYYFLTQTNNPTRFSELQPTFNTHAQVQEVISSLESRKIKHVLWDLHYSNTLARVFPASLHLPYDLAPVETYLRAHYNVIWSQNEFQILERKREPAMD